MCIRDSNKLELVGPDRSKMEVIAITDNVQRKAARLTSKADKAKGKYGIGESQGNYPAEVQGELEFEVGEIERALYATVSYTHLDVYKRQTSWRIPIRIGKDAIDVKWQRFVRCNAG